MTQQIDTSRRKSQSDAGQMDLSLKRQLEAHLRSQLQAVSHSIRCECHEGVVVLRGCVDSFHQKQLAQELARKVDGTKSVVNRLVVDHLAHSAILKGMNPFSHPSQEDAGNSRGGGAELKWLSE